jgi:hypothetical protein
LRSMKPWRKCWNWLHMRRSSTDLHWSG